MAEPARSRRRRGVSRAWRWLWHDTGPGERTVVLLAARAILAAAGFAIHAAFAGGPVSHCGL